MKRGIMGIYHNVSSEYLHRYLWQFDFLGTIASSMTESAPSLRVKQPKESG